MTRVTSIKDIGLVYEQMKEASRPVVESKPTEVVEEKAVKKLEAFPKATDKKINTEKVTAKGSDAKAFFHKNSGPEAAEGFNKNIIDPKTAKKDNFYQPQKFSTALEKTGSENINNHMKSIFDKLYEDVMGGDALDLGVKAGPEGAEADAKDLGLGGDEETTVTISLDKDLAQKLHDALVEVLGGESEAEDIGGESEDSPEGLEPKEEAEESKEDEKEEKEEQEEVAAETVEAQEIGHALVGSGVKGGAPTSPKGRSNVVAGVVSSLAKAGKARSDVTDKVGNDGDRGHALVGSGVKGGAPTSPKGTANVVKSNIKGGGKGDQNLFS